MLPVDLDSSDVVFGFLGLWNPRSGTADSVVSIRAEDGLYVLRFDNGGEVWIEPKGPVVKRWIKNCHTRYKRLVAMGVNGKDAFAMAMSRKGPWALSNAKPSKVAMPNQFFAEQGFLSLYQQYEAVR